jgi:hypothetical protein
MVVNSSNCGYFVHDPANNIGPFCELTGEKECFSPECHLDDHYPQAFVQWGDEP